MTGQVQTFRTISDDPSETAQRCIDLIARHAPRLMRAGGGGLTREIGVVCHVSPEMEREIVRRRQAEATYDEIGAALGFSASVVRRVCYGAGLPKRNRGRRRISVECAREMRRRRAAGESAKDVARALGLSVSAVQHYTAPNGKRRAYGAEVVTSAAGVRYVADLR